MPTKKKITKNTKARKAIFPKKKKKNKKGSGRPKARIREYFMKILPFLQRGLSLQRACANAGVPYQTVWDYQNKDAKFSEEIKVAQQTLELAARNVVANKINRGEGTYATWYLERKCKGEFSTRHENVNENHESDVVMIEVPKNDREVKKSDD